MNKRMWWVLLSALLLVLLAGCGGGSTTEVAKKDPNAAPEVEVAKAPSDYDEMVLIPAGPCTIGGPANLDITKLSSPTHKVNLKAFWIDKYEVTFDKFMKFTAETGFACKGDWRKYYSDQVAYQPVSGIILSDAEAYAKWAGKRLPTSEEWEKAASWDEKTQKAYRYPWGDEWKDGNANCGTSQLVNVGDKKFAKDVSFYGVRDMLGNIYEWTSSTYERYPGNKANDPNFTKGLATIMGASCFIQGSKWHIAARSSFPKNFQQGVGFRCAKNAAAGDTPKK